MMHKIAGTEPVQCYVLEKNVTTFGGKILATFSFWKRMEIVIFLIRTGPFLAHKVHLLSRLL